MNCDKLCIMKKRYLAFIAIGIITAYFVYPEINSQLHTTTATATALSAGANYELSESAELSLAAVQYQKEQAYSLSELTSGVTSEALFHATNPDAEVAAPRGISLVMVGDMLMHTKVLESGESEDGSYNFDHLFKYVGDEIAAADLALVNQETILGGSDIGLSSYPNFNSPFEVGDAEVAAGFDVILQATNHALDKGAAGVTNDIDFWKTNYPDITYLGINDSQDRKDNYIYTYTQDGITLSILNYTYGTNGISVPSSMPYAIDYLNEEKVVNDIKRAHEISDFVIVCPHWGTEYNLGVDSYQKHWTQIFLENDVDLVIGTHPHVIEPIEIVTDENDGDQMLVYYSLGNFVNGTESTSGTLADRLVGGIAQVRIGYDSDGNIGITEYDVEPIICHMGYGTDYTVYYLEDYTEELASQNRILVQDPSFNLPYCKELVKKVWGK